MTLDPVILHKLVNRRLFTAKDLLVATQLELVEALDISFEAAKHLVLIVSEAMAPRASTVSFSLTFVAYSAFLTCSSNINKHALAFAGPRSSCQSSEPDHTPAHSSESP